ncbi:HlyD family type I secretion periplasmic adaptor subunit [Vibrio sp. CK2-1]|uniref:HlyD family type I secretion periplasmic adaptor subunit n=1 Tax=Vibrio sp. CK2-1 TaxID=2912249 RepID=UPI001F01F52C|nr:HlyD family type I secretion periplasmic adaptor subunit [Vibrio sp. CK2-1]MCF7352552.1 HlyD family type I secretion periplasmic adaptor subunit [Vibrio sp. CK2-1]
MKKKLTSEQLDFVDDKSSALMLSTAYTTRIMLWTIVAFFIIAVIWASLTKLDKVTTGTGKVIPSTQMQVIQNLEGGIVKQVLVREGQPVKKGQRLLLIDDTQARSDFQGKASDIANMQADQFRLKAQIAAVKIDKQKAKQTNSWEDSVIVDESLVPAFDEDFAKKHPILVARQLNEYQGNVSNLENQLSVARQQVTQKQRELDENRSRYSNLQSSYNVANHEFNMTEPLAKDGVVPEIELLKLRRQLIDTRRDLTSTKMQIPVAESAVHEAILKYLDIALKYRSDNQNELNKVSAQLSSQSESQVGLQDKVNRTVVTSPVTGTIQKIYINTIGGVIQPGMDLIEIVPTEDTLLIEAKIAPQDIGFLHPGLPALIKFTAYNFSTYGGLDGTVETISADTIQDEEGNSFYQVKIRTDESALTSKDGTSLPIIPGMTASADIITGKRTVMGYLLKPVLKATDSALREQ